LEARDGSAAFTAIATGMKTGDRMIFTLMPDGVDTNVLVRYLTRDDQRQFERARRSINREVAKLSGSPRAGSSKCVCECTQPCQ
jgi:hypothetical protein